LFDRPKPTVGCIANGIIIIIIRRRRPGGTNSGQEVPRGERILQYHIFET